MQRVGFKMKLNPGQQEIYKKRHDEIWPELVQLLKDTGIYDYSIFLDEDTNTLFGLYKLKDGHSADDLPRQEIMQRWWAYMEDIMDTHPDHSPVSIPLKDVFYMP